MKINHGRVDGEPSTHRDATFTGAVWSEPLTLPGYVHDVGAAFFPFAAASPAFRTLDLVGAGLTWRHAPHGEQATPRSFTTATARIRTCLPPRAATAEKIAVRSAQLVSPYEAFSTLHPVNTSPVSSRTAAPTRNLEYGA